MDFTGAFNKVVEVLEALGTAVGTIVLPLAILCAIIAACMWIFSSDQQTSVKAKSWMIRIVTGILIAGLASGILTAINNAVSDNGDTNTDKPKQKQ